MTIGWALLIVAAVYLIERHKLWRRTFQIVGGLLVLAVLGIAGFVLKENHDAAEYRKRQAAETAPVTLGFSTAQPIEHGSMPVACFDNRIGKLVLPPIPIPAGFHLISCGPDEIQKPAGQCKQLVSDWFAAHAPGAPDCYLPVRPDYRKEAKPDPLGIRPGSTQSCTGTKPNDPCNIR